MSFRDEIFQLCKTAQKSDETKLISELIKGLSLVKDGEEYNLGRANFNHIAKYSNNQFYGYLCANDHIEEYKSVFPQIVPLSSEEVHILSKAHATIMMLIHGCLDDFKNNFPKLYFYLNPYWNYKPINSMHEKNSSILEKSNYQKAISAFKASELYQKLYTSNINEIFESFTDGDIQKMFAVFDHEMRNCPIGRIPESIDNFTKCLFTGYKSVPEILIAEIILIFAVRKSLGSACSLLFSALVGEDIIVLNNDNIISIDKIFSNALQKVITISCNDVFLSRATNIVGDILLIDCSPNANCHMHEFCFINSYTLNFDQEMGYTSKFTMAAIDDSLNPIYLLTDAIIKKDFPSVSKQSASMPPSTNPPITPLP